VLPPACCPHSMFVHLMQQPACLVLARLPTDSVHAPPTHTAPSPESPHIHTGTKLTYLPFVIKALSISLAKYPGLNTCLEPGGAALLQHHSHNIGVAMATSNGLVVPNIKQVSGVTHRVKAREALVYMQGLGSRDSHFVLIVPTLAALTHLRTLLSGVSVVCLTVAC
jgi:hypothetical protein